MAAPRTPADERVEQLLADLEVEREARRIAEQAAEVARHDAAEALRNAEDARRQLAPAMVEGGLLQDIPGKVMTVGVSLLDDNMLVNSLVAQLRDAGFAFKDHRQVQVKSADGMMATRWQSFERPLTPFDILAVQEEFDGDGYCVVTGDGTKYHNVMI